MSASEPSSALGHGLRGLAELYADLDRELAALKPRCELSGRCCNFKESGLTLFATDLEIEWLRRRTPPPSDVGGAANDPDLCPWWKGGLCHARDGRPLGCRVYFCDPTYQETGNRITEESVAVLKQLADAHETGWRYAPLHVFLNEAERPAPPPADTMTPDPPAGTRLSLPVVPGTVGQGDRGTGGH